MIEALAAAALRCPRPVVEQDLSFVLALLAGLAGFTAGKLLSDCEHRRKPPEPPPDC